MELVAAILGSAVTEGGRSLCGSFPSIKNFISFQSNLSALEKEMKSLVDLKNKVIEDVDYSYDAQMTLWLQEVEQILLEVNSVQAGMSMTSNNGKLYGCFFNCSERYRLSKETARMLKEVERLLKAGDIAAKMVGQNYLTKAVEHIPGPSTVNQTTASQHLAKVMIGVWGMGGVEIIEVTKCPRLIYLLWYCNEKLNTKMLEVIKVSFCEKVHQLFEHNPAKTEAPISVVPNLQIIEVINCNLRRVLPLSDLNESAIEKIRSDEL
ncbi:hypothetical protein Q3G72_020188 [Acer saccharum]|nr:hypothetical protein Q3G72_020188 [Acer saccharum]